MSDDTKAKTTPARNIIWADDKAEPFSDVSLGGVKVDPLPSAAEQKAGFYHPQAGLLIAAFTPYKAFREDKGKKE